MTPNRLIAITFRCLISALLALWVFSPNAKAQNAATGNTDSVGSVALSVCNAGRVDIDVFVAQSGKVSSAHIGAADCAFVAKSVGSMAPAYVGLAFVDARGQWGAARRQDLLPDFGIGVLSRANQSVPVRHGNTTVSLPMPILFQPRMPKCTTPPPSATSRLPYNATASQRAVAEQEDANSRRLGLDKPSCETLPYSLNVVAYPDSREITFNKFCDPCEKKAEARITPEERAARQRRSAAVSQEIGNLEATGPLGALVMGNVVKLGKQQAQEEEREREQERREQRPESYQRMNWNDMNLALAHVHPARGRPPEMPQYLIIRGTVSRVDVGPPGASEHWVDVYFRESSEQASSAYETSYGAFNVCTSDGGIFEDMFGPDFRSRMIGQVLEVRGEYQRYYCKGWKGSIRVTLARQLHSAGSKSGKDQSPADSGISYGDFLKALAKAEEEEPKKPPVESMQQMAAVYIMSENVANAAIMDHCRGMNDVYGNPYLTADEQRAATAGQNETNAKIAKCIPEYDAQAILSNRKAALEYCLHANNYLGDGRLRPRFDACMNQNDMLTAMCTQAMRFKLQFERRQFPGEDPNQSCYGPKPDGSEIQAILRAPSGGAAPGLPAKFLAPPPLIPNPRNLPPVQVPAGSVLQGTLVDAIAVETINVKHIFRLHLDTAQANLPAGAEVYLKVNVVGPGAQPGTVRLSISTDYVTVNDKRVSLNSNEIVQTIRSSSSAPGGPAIPFTLIPGTKLSFTSTSSTR